MILLSEKGRKIYEGRRKEEKVPRNKENYLNEYWSEFRFALQHNNREGHKSIFKSGSDSKEGFFR